MLAAAPVLDLDFSTAFPSAPHRRAAFMAATTNALMWPQHSLRRLLIALEVLFNQAFTASTDYHIASWLIIVAAKGVEQLELHLPRSLLAVLPPSLQQNRQLPSAKADGS
ncbi:hypothetical protein GUJ93_ZPchr0010g8343 [Zizania palustris]|uniref:Uncharacterized protein n=1 Tax=Zizania palustris TaxID=103762 RepID=A0A8J5WCP2_ZIZPA|nr:hypothetical protein GUJ93_ZPchr0010g8343 [Zizania palustris]